MAINVARFEHQSRIQWGVLQNERIIPIPGDIRLRVTLCLRSRSRILPQLRGADLSMSEVEILSPVTRNQQLKVVKTEILQGAAAMTTVFDFTAQALSGEDRPLRDFSGKVLLIVNTASKCGLTHQYKGLEALHRKYGPQGFEVLGFPCNQFGAQEPGGAAEIASFCSANYGVSFPMFAKIEVNGRGAHPLFAHLKREKPGRLDLLGLWESESIKWNFTKFLVDRRGLVRERFSPVASPESLRGAIEGLLRAP